MRLYEGEAGRVYTVEAVVQKKLGEEWARHKASAPDEKERRNGGSQNQGNPSGSRKKTGGSH